MVLRTVGRTVIIKREDILDADSFVGACMVSYLRLRTFRVQYLESILGKATCLRLFGEFWEIA